MVSAWSFLRMGCSFVLCRSVPNSKFMEFLERDHRSSGTKVHTCCDEKFNAEGFTQLEYDTRPVPNSKLMGFLIRIQGSYVPFWMSAWPLRLGFKDLTFLFWVSMWSLGLGFKDLMFLFGCLHGHSDWQPRRTIS